MIRKLFCLLFLVFCRTLASFGQNSDALLNNCGLLEKIVNDSAVKSYLFTREHFISLQNFSTHFQNCDAVLINGKKYSVYDSTAREMTSGYLAVHMYVRTYSEMYQGQENKNIFFVILDYVPQEQGALIKVEKVHGVYNVKLQEIFRED